MSTNALSDLTIHDHPSTITIFQLKDWLQHVEITDPKRLAKEIPNKPITSTSTVANLQSYISLQQVAVTAAGLENLDHNPSVKDLGNSLLSIQHDLDHVHSDIALLDQKNYTTKVSVTLPGGRIPKFQSDWDNIRKDFNRLLLKSIQISEEGSKRAEEYRTIMLPIINDPDIDLQDMQLELGYYIQELDKTTFSGKIAEEFLQLPLRIEDFKTRVSAALRQSVLGVNPRSFAFIKTHITSTLARTNSVCDRITAIGQIWNDIRTDAKRILLSMESAKVAPKRITFKYKLKDEFVGNVYRDLELVFIDYANQVTQRTSGRG